LRKLNYSFTLLFSKPILFLAGILFALMFLAPNSLLGQAIFINEIMASNATTIADEDGDFEDWIELYNDEEFAINLEGYFLSDNPNNPLKWELPEVVVEPQGFLLIFASGKDRIFGPNLHTNFSISIDGEPILLSSPEGDLVDYLPDVVLQTDISFGRIPDGESEMILFSESTPGTSNLGGVPHSPLTDVITFSAEQGLYESAFELFLDNINPDADIYYTLNGSDPDTTSYLFQNHIPVFNRSDLPNSISTIPTTTWNASHPYHWIPPDGSVFKGTVIKARSFSNGEPTSKVYTHTYLVDENIQTRYNQLPIFSIVTDSLNLFDYETGIHVPGIAADEETLGIFWWGYGNFFGRGMDWERPAHLTFIESDGSIAIDQNVGIRIHGNSTRSLPIKSFRLIARNQYGNNSLDHNFFPWKDVQEYKHLLLRQSGNDFSYNYFGDALSALIADSLDFEKQDYRPAVVFINGEFWGIMNIRDRRDHRFLSYSTGLELNEGELTVNTGWWNASPGSPELYQGIQSYMETNDLSEDEHYQDVIGHFELNSLLDYFITKIYIAVYDWPGNNVSFWRHESESPLWRWIYFDNDHCMIDPGFNALEHATLEDGTSWPNPSTSTLLLRSLLKNEGFKGLFLERFEYLLQHSFTEENVLQLTDSILTLISPVMPEHFNRWQYPADLETWSEEIELIGQFAKDRPCHMLSHLIDFFEITDPTYAMGVCDSISTPIPPVLAHSDQIAIWPNPATEHLHLRTAEEHRVQSIQCYDGLGRLVDDISVSGWRKGENFTIQLGHLAKGHYLLHIQSDNETLFSRFIKI